MRTHEGGFYIRLSVYDRPGAIAAIATRMAEQNISLESVVQKRDAPDLPGFGHPGNEGEPTPVVMITHRTRENLRGQRSTRSRMMVMSQAHPK